ncbi:BON domain-containing protein [Actinokineospora alba]|uniref:BON domain-containing protein n=1 Tax=Actinokineospora alba TaxID=504798 RepID=A0A1H0FQ86_9PSEU|nr:BON domain-containing protein [Actinokineospora alba]TDP69564.1 BON domain-containing protein [Actinokineospora alba]SDI14043.1 BON domain-containing protein [Actinokineospora alba]SDN96649.1 BON domain-containing protein [Actinokineospora alba]
MTIQDRIDTYIPAPRTPPGPPDLSVRVRAALNDVPGVDTSLVRAAVDGGDVLLVGRVQWSSEAEKVVRRVHQVTGIARLRNRIGFHYDDVDDSRLRGLSLFG